MSAMPSDASFMPGAVIRMRPRLPLVGDRFALVAYVLLALAVVVCTGSGKSCGAESSNLPLAIAQIADTNVEPLIRASLQIQEQLQATQLALERDRAEAREAAAQNAAALSKRLETLQEVVSEQGARELESIQGFSQAMQRSNRAMLIVAGAIAAIGFLALAMMSYFQWRTTNAWAAISASLPMSRGLGAVADFAALGPGEPRLAPDGPVEQSNLRLLGAIEQLDKHIHEFKGAAVPNGNGETAAALNRDPVAAGSEPLVSNESGRIPLLLTQAQAMSKADNADAALACFDEVLALDPKNTDALVRKGAALERLHKLNEAMECYDRALAADGSMILAYLHKGGLCNRLERFKEALECYEKALRTCDQRGS